MYNIGETGEKDLARRNPPENITKES